MCTSPDQVPKNLIICCDGTSNGPTHARTNVIKLWLALERDEHQIVYYDPGVGTLGNPSRLTTLGKAISRWIDLAAGTGLRQNVIEAYEFLMDHYVPGDQIFLFGFSRGAYTVRALAGMLEMCGLLHVGAKNFVPHLWQIYSNEEGRSTTFGKRMRVASEIRRFNVKPEIKFLGVWDTVSSWGFFFNFRSLLYTAKIKRVAHIRHAVAIDERRAAFRQNLFDPKENRDLLEVWFAGTHCDVGGGHPEEDSGLSKVALEWMIDEASQFGLRLDARMVAKMLGQANRKGRTQYAAPDASAKLHQSLKGAWKILEYLPRPVWKRDPEKRKWKRVWRLNRGRRRYYRANGSAIHLSVGERVRNKGYQADGIV